MKPGDGSRLLAAACAVLLLASTVGCGLSQTRGRFDQAERNFLQQWCELYAGLPVTYVPRRDWRANQGRALSQRVGQWGLQVSQDVCEADFAPLIQDMEAIGWARPGMAGSPRMRVLMALQARGIQRMVEELPAPKRDSLFLLQAAHIEFHRAALDAAKASRDLARIARTEQAITQSLVALVNRYPTAYDTSAPGGVFEKVRQGGAFICVSQSALLHGLLERVGIAHSGLKVKDLQRFQEPHASLAISLADGTWLRADPTYGYLNPIRILERVGHYHRLDGPVRNAFICQVPVDDFFLAEGLIAFGDFHFDHKEPRLAERRFTEAMRLTGHDASEYLGRVFADLARAEPRPRRKKALYRQAVTWIENALRTFPAHYQLRIVGADYLFQAGEADRGMTWKRLGMEGKALHDANR